MNAAAYLLREGSPTSIALIGDESALTYAELRAAVARAAGLWRARGVRPGDRVAIQLADGIDWIVGYLGAIWAGGVAVALNPRLAEQALPAGAADSFGGAPSELHAVMADAGCVALLGAADDVRAWRAAVAAAAPIAPFDRDPNAPAFWLYTSGTSGRPKAVVHRQRAVLNPERFAQSVLAADARDRFYSSSRLFFAYPLANCLFTALRLGAAVVVQSAWPTAANVRATIERTRPTIVYSVPALFRALLREGDVARFAALGVRACVTAGEALPVSIREAWAAQTSLPLVDGLGTSETLCLMLTDYGDGKGLRAVPGVELRAHAHAPDAASTRLEIAADTIAAGYWRRPELEAEHFIDGRFVPGDFFEQIAPACWRFAGREDSLVKVKGRWVDLMALDDRIAQGAGAAIAEGACLVRADADGLASIAFFYVAAKSDARVRLAAFTATLPPHQRPTALYEIPALPRTPTGKLQRRALEQFANRGF